MVKFFLPRGQRRVPSRPQRPLLKPQPKKQKYNTRYIVEATTDAGRTRKLRTFRDKDPKIAKENAKNFIAERKYRYPGMVYKVRPVKVRRGWL